MNSGTVATTFQHTPHPLYPSVYQPSKLPNAKWESEIPAPQQHTTARITPLSFAYSASNRGGYIPLPPPRYTHSRSEIRAKETPSVQCVETTSRNGTTQQPVCSDCSEPRETEQQNKRFQHHHTIPRWGWFVSSDCSGTIRN